MALLFQKQKAVEVFEHLRFEHIETKAPPKELYCKTEKRSYKSSFDEAFELRILYLQARKERRPVR
jgi:hypothetical protein